MVSDPPKFAISSRRGGVEVIDDVAEEWRRLCDANVGHQPFCRPEWIRAHVRAHYSDAKVLLVEARVDERLVMVLPLLIEFGTLSRVPVRKLRAPVNCYAGRFDLVCRPDPIGKAAVRASWEYLRSLNGWDLLEFRYSQRDGNVSKLVAAARADEYSTMEITSNPNPFVGVPTDPALLHQLPINSRLRTKLRQIRRQMAEQGTVKFYRIDVADRNAIERIYQLEASGWKGREGSATICMPRVKRFFDEVAESAARFGYLALYMLEFKGTLIAAHFALTHQGRCYSPIVAFNEDFKQFSPGHLIVSEILQDCAARGITGYDITGENQEWKLKWTNELLPISHHYIFKGPLGKLAYTVETRLKPAFRRSLPKNRLKEDSHAD